MVAGAGKSFLSTIVINELKRGQACQVAFLYLSYKQETSEKNLLGNLASQLIAQRLDPPELPVIVQTLWNSENDKRKKTKPFEQAPEFSQLEQLLSALVTNDTFLVIDALDGFDSSQHHSLLYRLTRIQNANPKLLITSRDKEAEGFDAIDVIANDNDIKNYIEQAISHSRLSDFVNQDSTLREEITLEVAKKADGIFLLPRLYMVALAACFSPSDVRRALKKLPHDRNSAYESTLERINNQEKMRPWAMAALGWILHAQEPLQVDELRHALLIGGSIDQSLSAGDAIFNHANLLSEEAILACCCGLVEIELNPDGWDTFRFIHYSVQEFLAANRERLFPGFHARVSLASAKYFCLPRLANSNWGPENAYTEALEDGPNDYSEEYRKYQRLHESQKHEQLRRKQLCYGHREDILRVSRLTASYFDGRGVLKNLNFDLKFLLYPFIGYAGKYLGRHFSDIDGDYGRSIVEEQICRHLQSSSFYANLVDYESSHVSGYAKPNYRLAAHMGSSTLVKRFLEDQYPRRSGWQEWRTWLSIRNFVGKLILSNAVQSKQPRILKFILGSADVVDLTDWDGCSLLITATKGNDEENYSKEVNQVLDEICADLKMREKTESSKSWITWASDRFAEKFNQSRLSAHHFREINPIELGDHIRLLSCSAKGNSAEVLTILGRNRVALDKIDTNASNISSRTRSCLAQCSFFLAVENLHLEVVRAFLDHGIDVNLQESGMEEETPIYRAASRGSFLMVELLLSFNARVDIRSVWDTVLDDENAAARSIIPHLLRATVTQPAALDYASAAFKNAIRKERIDLVESFVEDGLNLSPSLQERCWHGSFPLYEAVCTANMEIIKLLLEHNADPNVIVRDGYSGCKTILDVVLEWNELYNWWDHQTVISISELLKLHGAKTAEELQASQTTDDGEHSGSQAARFISFFTALGD